VKLGLHSKGTNIDLGSLRENRVLRRIFGTKGEEVVGQLHNLYA